MPKKKRELGNLDIKRLVYVNGLHFVGGVAGLALQVSGAEPGHPATATSWILRVTVAGKRRDHGLGGYPTVGLADARCAAREARAKIRLGIDPIEEARASRLALHAQRLSSYTFEQAANAYISLRQCEWRNAKHRAQWPNTLTTYAFPLIGCIPVNDIAQSHVMQVLEPIWHTKTETATRLRGRIETILDWAIASGHRKNSENPARWRGYLDKLLPAPSKIAKVDHHLALPFTEIAKFVAKLRTHDGMGAKALEFAILTAARSGEVRLATWDEISFDTATWIIPALRMKAMKEHRVPLSESALALLRSLHKSNASSYIFPNGKGHPLSDMTLTQQMRRMGARETVHGFRSTFRDWGSECTNFPPEVLEMALAHTIGNKVEAAYRRGKLLDKRRELMAQWATYCDIAAPCESQS